MKYRVYPEPLDIEAKNRDDAIEKYFIDDVLPPICKILLIDEDGFVIRQTSLRQKTWIWSMQEIEPDIDPKPEPYIPPVDYEYEEEEE